MIRSLLLSLFSFATVVSLATEKPLIKFKENKTQWPSKVHFMGEFYNGKVFLEKNAFVFEVIDAEQLSVALKKSGNRERKEENHSLLNGHVYRTIFADAQTENIQGSEKQSEYYNYFLGTDQSKWSSHVNAFKTVHYKELYKGIDMQVYSEGANFKYDLIVASYADINQIKIQVEDADAVFLSGKNIFIKTTAGTITEMAPVAWQFIHGKKVSVACEYLLKENSISYSFPKGYDKKYALLIDPVVVACTFTGSTVYSNPGGASYDEKGNGYLIGDCAFQGFPATTGAFQVSMNGARDLTFHKFNPDGSRLLHATYFGGTNEEKSFCVDIRKNEAVIMGYTESVDFPTKTGAFDNTHNGGADIFLTKLDTSGSLLIQSTYVGGTGKDAKPLLAGFEYFGNSEIVRDSKGHVYVASFTRSLDFPVSANAFAVSLAGISFADDAIIFKMDSALSTMIWSTYLGGSNGDAAHSLRLDGHGGIYCAGTTNSYDFPVTTGVVSPVKNSQSDCFITHINNIGTALIASTFVGTNATDYGNLMALDNDTNVYILSMMETSNPSLFTSTPGAFNNAPTGRNLIHKLSPDLSQFVFKARFGTSSGSSSLSYLFPSAFEVDSCGNIYAAGDATSNFPTSPNAEKTVAENSDIYYCVFTKNAASLKYASYFGGPNWESTATGKCKIDKKGVLYFGFFGDIGMPVTPNAYATGQPHLGSSNNFDTWDHGFLKIDPHTFLTATSYASGQSSCTTDNMLFINQSATGNVQWNFGDGSAPVFLQDSVSHTYTSPGIYDLLLIATDTSTCNDLDTLITQVHVYTTPQQLLPDVSDLCLNGEVVLYAGNPGSAYLWSTGATTQTITTTQTGLYSVAITNAGCTITDASEVIVSAANAEITFPNIITPNGDGLNDKLDLSDFYVDEFDLHIFDRWGREVFSSSTVAWDGTINGKAVDGTYFYTLSYITDCIKATQEARGYITVIK
ncbi:MAG: hypothetical protein K0S33_1499 [Bacteroidetes bacterium]|jgi:gliding motility-associated-like protein|nr:hypothetical protein [Bacteroidota bacterium]